MASNNSPDYKRLLLEAEKKWKQAEESQRKAEEEQKREAELRRQAEEQNQPTTFGGLIQYGHNIIARSLRIANQSRCTSGKISAPIGKKCPVKLRPWTECQTQQEDIYRSVCNHLGSTGDTARRSFPPLVALGYEGQNVKERPISSERDLEGYERSAFENHVRNIIAELCKIPTARDEFRLGDGVQFDSHANNLDLQTNQSSRPGSSSPDQYCIHRIDDGTSTLLTTVEYKPPHKLPVESLRRLALYQRTRINVHRFADGVDHDRVNWCGFPVHDMFRRINAPLSQVIRLALI